MTKKEMDSSQVEKPKTVEKLEHFPFKTFDELKKAIAEGVANIGVDRGVALQWAQGGIYCPKSLSYYALFLAFLPFLAAIGFIIYAIVSSNWLLLLALPVLLIAFFVFHPSSAMIFGPIRSGFIGLSFIGLAYAFFADKAWLLALTITLIIIWWAQKTIYKKAINHITLAMTEHEDLLCLLWSGKVVNIRFYNGNSYWVDWKSEDGKNIHYNDNK